MANLLFNDDPLAVKDRLNELFSGLVKQYGFVINC